MFQLKLKIRNLFKNRNKKVRSLQALNHVLFILALFVGSPQLWFLSLLLYFLFFCFGVNIGVHRYFSHKSFKTNAFVEWFLGILFTLNTVGSSLSWVGMHRQHHEFADQEQDPHSPLDNNKNGKAAFNAYVGLWKPYIAKASYTKDLRRSKLHMTLHFYYFLVIIAYCFFLFLIFGWKGILFGYSVPAVFCFHGASIIVTAGHLMGKQHIPTNDQSKNSLFVHWLTWGEGLHNLHHAAPGKKRFKEGIAEKWYFFDLPGFIIEYFLESSPRHQEKKVS